MGILVFIGCTIKCDCIGLILFRYLSYLGAIICDINTIGLYRENSIAIESDAKDPFGGNVYYVTMQMTFHIPEFTRNEHNLHCDVVHITTIWVARLVLDDTIAAIQTS